MKLKWNKQNYCVSQCAKDKFQNCIINPIMVILALTITLLFIALAIGIIGIISQILFVTLGWNIIPNIMEQGFAIVLIGIISGAILWIIYNIFKGINNIIDNWANRKYEKKYKKSCTLLERCE